MDARHAAVQVLTQVYAGRSLTAAPAEIIPGIDDPRDRALAQDLCYGVLRWGPRLEAAVRLLVHRPLPRRDADVQCLILIGLYQMIHTRIPPHAAVAATVDVASRLGKPRARGMVNAVLRRFQREAGDLLARVDTDEAQALACPAWLAGILEQDWPLDWRTIAQAGNRKAPMCLRVNLSRGGREGYLLELGAAGIGAAPQPHTAAGIVLDDPVDVTRLPGFAEGRVSVQDGAAQLAAPLLDVGPGQRVLDLCAAPGGKTAHILETQPDLAELVAVDIDMDRLHDVRRNLVRLGLRARLVCADGARADAWWRGEDFDRILLDAPCSGTGVIRRHPDIKRLRRAADIEPLVARQRELLDAAWRVLAPGGMLLYATCSIIHQENNAQLQDFIARHQDARVRGLDASWGRPLPFGRQILPGEDGMDGFFYACVDKVPASDSPA